MTELGKIVAICLVGILLALLLQKNNPELAILLALAVCAGVLVFGLGHMKRVLAMLERTGAELCRDANQKAIASVVEAVGAFSAVVVSIPLLGAVWELLRGML